MRLLLFNLATDADDPILGFTTRWIEARDGQVRRAWRVPRWKNPREPGECPVVSARELARVLTR